MASAWGVSWGNAWGNSWGAVSAAAALVGRPIRLRGRYRQHLDEVVCRVANGDIDQVAQEYTQQIIEQAREIAQARTDLEMARRAFKRGKDTAERLALLESAVIEAEENMAEIKDEEEFILILALSI